MKKMPLIKGKKERKERRKDEGGRIYIYITVSLHSKYIYIIYI